MLEKDTGLAWSWTNGSGLCSCSWTDWRLSWHIDETYRGKAPRPRSPAGRVVVSTALCERKNRAEEAFSYNGLIQSWPEIRRVAREEREHEGKQRSFFATEDG